jgi:cytochrome c-type biogenesis protein CcsB
MSRSTHLNVRCTVFSILFAAGAIFMAAQPAEAQRVATASPDDPFLAEVDLAPLGSIAVYTNGRLKSFESFAREMMTHITGAKRINDQPLGVTFFDLMLHPELYVDADFIYVPMKLMRVRIADAIRTSIRQDTDPMRGNPAFSQLTPDAIDEFRIRIDARLERFIETGLTSPAFFNDPEVGKLMQHLSADLVRTAKKVDQLETAMVLRRPEVLRAQFTVVPPAGGFDDQWLTFEQLRQRAVSQPLSADEQRALDAWDTFSAGWMNSDAAEVNRGAAELSAVLPRLNPSLYPDRTRLASESWYFNPPAWAGGRNMVGVWIYYALALVPLLLSVVFRWKGAHWVGIGMFMIAFGFHTAAILLRWYVAQRWPNTNMFEAVTTAAWFGGCFAVLLEVFLWKYSLRGLIALGSAAASAVAMMAAKFMPTYLNPNISNQMPVLHDVWLYIHTNVIIFSYCLIFMASVTATLYIVYRGLMAMRGQSNGAQQFARVGGAGSLIVTGPAGITMLESDRTTLGQVLDGTTMILMELSFVLLWAGIVMGAIWADHSWGRPWGWDPKEVFALNTFIIFLILVHVRLKVRDKGFWTAVLAMIGCVVMLFNWIVINFTIAGLHSYAGG